MASAVPQKASEARSAGCGAKASGVEARQGRDATCGSLHRTKARPERAARSKADFKVILIFLNLP
jgi:hypothetical protein